MKFVPGDKIKYTDMCIYIDENVLKDDCDDKLVFNYLCELFYMFASKSRFFRKAMYYEPYALFGATKVFFRLKNTNLPPVKSVLNYIKKVLYPTKVDFEQQEYSQEVHNIECVDLLEYENIVDATSSELESVSFEASLGDIVHTCKYVMEETPFRKGTPEFENVYISVLLSLLNELTLNKENKEKIARNTFNIGVPDDIYNFAFKRERDNSTILFRVDESLEDYITVLVRKIKHYIKNSLFLDFDSSYYRIGRKI